MRIWIIGFLIGIISLNTFQNLPHPLWISLGLTPLVFLFLPNRLWQWLRLPLAILFGFSWGLAHVYLHNSHTLPQAFVNKGIQVQGIIRSLPEQKAQGWQFDFAIQRLAYQNTWQPMPLYARLTWKHPPSTLFTGQEWQLQVQLKPPNSTLNPGEFDYEAWLFARQINVVGYVRSNQANQLLHASHWIAWVQHIRQHLAQSIAASLSGSPMTGFIQALAVGVRDQISEDQWQVLRNTGTNHLMAIAGLHIGLVTGAIWFIVSFLARRCGRLPLYIPITQIAAFAALIIALIYSALAGFALPTERAVIMISVFLLATLLRRQLPLGQALLLALYAVLLLDPLTTLSASFWLSFSAVALIIYGLAARVGQPHWLQRWGYIQWMLAIGLIPWTLLFFQQISLSGILANFIAIPWVGFIVLPLTLLGNLSAYLCPPVAAWLFKLAAQMMALFWPVLVKIASWHWLQWQGAIPNIWLLFTTLVGVWLLLAPRGLPGRWIGVFWLLPLFCWQPMAPKAGQVWLSLLDVGQGLVAVVRTQHHTLIYAVEPSFNTRFNKVNEIVIPFLRENKIGSIHSLILNSHFNLTQSLTTWAGVAPQHIVSNVAEDSGFKNVSPCLAGDTWQWDGVQFSYIYPTTLTQTHHWQDSCVLYINAKKQPILLLGDVGRDSVTQLLQPHAPSLSTDILVAFWHRYNEHFLSEIISNLHPHYVLYSTNSVLSASGTMYNTATCGAITVHLNGDKTIATPDCYRLSKGRYWNKNRLLSKP
ncbi:MAG: DNA internalization-related competence protein ComEC/Rec2 [Gammaproteobacteria bacterium]